MIPALLLLIASVTGIARTESPELAASAQLRAETVICGDQSSFYGHVGKPDGATEILICFSDTSATIEQAVSGWMASAPHRAVLLDANLHSIGCARHVAAAWVMYTCHLSPGLPNTAMGPVSGWGAALVLLAVIGFHVEYRRVKRARERSGHL